MSDDAWLALDEDEPGELVDGTLVEEEAPDYAHEVIVAWLAWVLMGWVQVHGGQVATSDAKFLLRQGRGRKPDLSVYLPGTAPPPRRGAVRTPPDIMIEVVTPKPRDQRRDRLEKMDEYAAFGVRWYWIVDPEARLLEIYERDPRGVYARVRGASEGRVTDLPGLPELTMDLDAAWARIDALGEPEE